uniref:Reverse transcriptase domain-containing protein n=1 Tax=Tanacetum cinerariifolium TaxID=118510 RepID=A0A699J9J2_TANCI|nr:hypothetical protein [Tanacetum cinerariifolium]
MIDDEEMLQSREKFMKAIQTFLQKFSRYSFGAMPKVLLIAWERFSKIKHAFTDKQYQQEEIQELLQKLLEDVRNINEELAEYINSPSWNNPNFYNDDEEHSIQYKEYLENSSDAIATVLPTEEPEYSLSMRYEHPSTTPKTESDEVIKSSVKNLIQIPSEYEVTSDDESSENFDYDSKGDIHFIEKLLGNYSILFPENESSNFDNHDDPSFPRPPPELPDVEFFFDFEPNSGKLISAVMNSIDELNEDECFDPGGGEIDICTNIKDDDYFPFVFVIRNFLPYLIYLEVSPLLLSAGSEDTIFDHGIST